MSNLVPMVLERTADGERSFDIFSMMLNNRVIFLTGEVNDAMADRVKASIQYLESKNDKDITVYISSPGGSVYSGLAMYNAMKHSKCDMVTIVDSHAMSMGSFLAACGGTKGKRFIMPEADHMIHQPLGGAQGQQTEIEISAKHIKKMRDQLERIYAESTGQSQEVMNKLCDRDNFLDAEESVSLGLADAILTNELRDQLENQTIEYPVVNESFVKRSIEVSEVK